MSIIHTVIGIDLTEAEDIKSGKYMEELYQKIS